MGKRGKTISYLLRAKNKDVLRLVGGPLVFAIILGMTVPVYALPPVDTMYGSVARGSSVDPGALVTIDDSNGMQTFLADNITPDGISSLAFDNSGRLFSAEVLGAGLSGGRFLEFNPDTGGIINSAPSVTLADGTNIKINDMTVHPLTNVLYGLHLTAATGELYTINKATGIAAFVGSQSDVRCGGLAFTPDGKLWLASCTDSSKRLLELNPATGGTISNTLLQNSYDGMGSRSDGTLFASRAAAFGADGAEIWIINPSGPTETFVGTDTRGISDVDFSRADIPVGGTFIPIDQTALLLAGVQSISMWMIPVVIAGIGIGVFVIKRRK